MAYEFITVDLARELGKLYRYSGAPWYLALILKTYDETGKSVTEIEPRKLIPEMYCDFSKANKGTKTHLGRLGAIKMNNRTEFLFGIEVTPTGSYIVKLNSKVDSQLFARGFSAFPSRILNANAVEANLEKTRSMVLAAFIYLQKHAKELAARGCLETNLRTILKIMYSKIPSDLRRLEQMANTLKNSIESAKPLTQEDGVIFSVEYCEENDVNKFLDDSILTIKLIGDTLKIFLAAFGMEPAVRLEQSKPEPITIPFETETKEINSETVKHQDAVVATIHRLDELEMAATSDGDIDLDSLVQHTLANSTADIERYKRFLEETCKKIADILTEIEFCMNECYGAEEIADWWKAVLACKTGEGYRDLKQAEFYLSERVGFLYTCYPSVVWNIIKDFVLRLRHISLCGNFDALGALRKVNYVRFWLKEEQMNWSIEELEEIIAGLEGNSRKVAQA